MTSPYQYPCEIVTEIEMSRDAIPWLTVEGDTDERLFRSRRFPRNVKIVAADGWEGVRDVLIGANNCQHNTIVIGVIDRDYRDQNNSQPMVRGLILTDLRDIEGVMFWSSALHRVYCELGSLEKLPKRTRGEVDYSLIRKQIISTCAKIGLFRSYCYMSGQSVSFRELNYAKFICDRSLNLEVSRFLDHLRGRNSGTNRIDNTAWDEAQSAKHLRQEYRDPKWICHGHDLMAMVTISLRRMWGSNGGQVSREEIESNFRVGFSDAELEATSMWGYICGYLGC